MPFYLCFFLWVSKEAIEVPEVVIERELKEAEEEFEMEQQDILSQNFVSLPHTTPEWYQWLMWCEEHRQPVKPAVATLKAFLTEKVCLLK
jgi:hypothetical protein